MKVDGLGPMCPAPVNFLASVFDGQTCAVNCEIREAGRDRLAHFWDLHLRCPHGQPFRPMALIERGNVLFGLLDAPVEVENAFDLQFELVGGNATTLPLRGTLR